MTCPECTETGRKGYCAPLRCYCGHPSCHAAASYYEPELPATAEHAEHKHASAWATREGPTWIDQM